MRHIYQELEKKELTTVELLDWQMENMVGLAESKTEIEPIVIAITVGNKNKRKDDYGSRFEFKSGVAVTAHNLEEIDISKSGKDYSMFLKYRRSECIAFVNSLPKPEGEYMTTAFRLQSDNTILGKRCSINEFEKAEFFIVSFKPFTELFYDNPSLAEFILNNIELLIQTLERNQGLNLDELREKVNNEEFLEGITSVVEFIMTESSKANEKIIPVINDYSKKK